MVQRLALNPLSHISQGWILSLTANLYTNIDLCCVLIFGCTTSFPIISFPRSLLMVIFSYEMKHQLLQFPINPVQQPATNTGPNILASWYPCSRSRLFSYSVLGWWVCLCGQENTGEQKRVCLPKVDCYSHCYSCLASPSLGNARPHEGTQAAPPGGRATGKEQKPPANSQHQLARHVSEAACRQHPQP